MRNWDLSSMLDATPVLCFVIDAEEKLQVLSGGLAVALQINTRDAIGKSPFTIPFFPIKRHHFRKAHKGALTITLAIQGAQYETQLSPAMNGAVIGLTTDMTKHMLMEQYLDEERHKLLVSQRLSSLAGIANGLAHEINNPLAIISGYAELINNLHNEGSLNEKQLLHAMDKILEASQRCHRIIESIKTFARDGSKDQIETLDLNDLVRAATDLCSQRIASEGIRLIVVTAGPVVTLEGRRLQLLQSLFNLIQNACDAVRGQPSPTIEVSCSQTKERVRIAVTDNGVGIPGSIRNRIFEPFFTTKSETGNVGVGLSTTKGIIEEHHGKLEFVSEGGSTSFTMELPKLYQVTATAS